MASPRVGMTDLTLKQQRFCEYYAKNGNATESARLAGYSDKTANEQGSRLLVNVSIQEYLKSLTQPQTDKLIADAIERQRFLTEVMRGEIIDNNDGFAKNTDRIKACVELGKLQGDYIEKQTITHNHQNVRDEILERVLAGL